MQDAVLTQEFVMNRSVFRAIYFVIWVKGHAWHQ